MFLDLEYRERITYLHLAKLNSLYIKEQLVFNQIKFTFKLRNEELDARIALPVLNNNHLITTRAKSRVDFQVEMVTTEQ